MLRGWFAALVDDLYATDHAVPPLGTFGRGEDIVNPDPRPDDHVRIVTRARDASITRHSAG
jgi:hypothetical protein